MNVQERTGFRVDSHGWPIWPAPSPDAGRRLEQVLASGRWSISGWNTGTLPMEREFAAAFAAWMNIKHCIPTANGTSALLAALDGLGIGVGDEVIVPGLTWVAPAVAVLQCNACPIIVDIDPATLCLSPDAIEAAITPRTRAIIIVHLYSSVADLDRINAIAARHNLSVIEDCAQSHGSVWKGRKVGSWSDVGIFSMHQGKPLTCGEGGAAVTSNDDLASKMEQLRANGRCYKDGLTAAGEFDLQEVGRVLGTNMALSEFQAAVALDGLEQLDRLNERRAAGARFLDAELGRIDGLRTVSPYPQVEARTYYHYVIRFDPAAFHGWSAETFAAELTRQLGCPWQPTYIPLNRHPLYVPLAQKRYALSAEFQRAVDPGQRGLPVAEAVHRTSVIVHHRILLSPVSTLARIPDAMMRLKRSKHPAVTGDTSATEPNCAM